MKLVALHVATCEERKAVLERLNVLVHLVTEEAGGEVPFGHQRQYLLGEAVVLATDVNGRKDDEVELISDGRHHLQAYHQIAQRELTDSLQGIAPVGNVGRVSQLQEIPSWETVGPHEPQPIAVPAVSGSIVASGSRPWISDWLLGGAVLRFPGLKGET